MLRDPKVLGDRVETLIPGLEGAFTEARPSPKPILRFPLGQMCVAPYPFTSHVVKVPLPLTPVLSPIPPYVSSLH